MIEVKVIPLSKLHLNTGQIKDVPKNPRFIRDESYAKTKKSIQDDPEMLSIREIVAYDNSGELVVILGNQRFRVLKELGEKTAIVKILPSDTPAKKLRAYIVKDNTHYGEHDYDILFNEYDDDPLDEWGIVTGTDYEEQSESEKKKKHLIEVTCKDEESQLKTFEKLQTLGIDCRIK